MSGVYSTLSLRLVVVSYFATNNNRNISAFLRYG